MAAPWPKQSLSDGFCRPEPSNCFQISRAATRVRRCDAWHDKSRAKTGGIRPYCRPRKSLGGITTLKASA